MHNFTHVTGKLYLLELSGTCIMICICCSFLLFWAFTDAFAFQGLDIAQAKNHERQVMLDDAQHLVDCVNSGERIRAHRHPKSGATALHVAAAKGYNEVLK